MKKAHQNRFTFTVLAVLEPRLRFVAVRLVSLVDRQKVTCWLWSWEWGSPGREQSRFLESAAHAADRGRS